MSDIGDPAWPDELAEFSRSRLAFGPRLQVGERHFAPSEVIAAVEPLLTAERIKRLKQVVAGRTRRLVPIFENPYDLGNVSAVMRTAEAFGFLEFDLVIPPGSRFKSANRVARGANKWLDVHIHRSATDCARELKGRGFQVLATHLEATRPIEEFDFTRPTAIVLGNEHSGVSDEMLTAVDGQFLIPMQGFTQSFNISVAAAICGYHAWQKRTERFGASGDLNRAEQEAVYANYLLRCLDNPAAILERQRPPTN